MELPPKEIKASYKYLEITLTPNAQTPTPKRPRNTMIVNPEKCNLDETQG